jgi:hypothetical protein
MLSALNLLLVQDKTYRNKNKRRPQKFNTLRTFVKTFKFRFQSYLILFNLKYSFEESPITTEES